MTTRSAFGGISIPFPDEVVPEAALRAQPDFDGPRLTFPMYHGPFHAMRPPDRTREREDSSQLVQGGFRDQHDITESEKIGMARIWGNPGKLFAMVAIPERAD
jgi:hypothetical protein